MFIEFLREIKKYFKLLHFKTVFRKRNKHNFVKVNRVFDIDKVKVGVFSYGNLNIYTFNNPKEHLEIGNFCSIADNVIFLLSGEHNYKYISTYPFKAKFGMVSAESMCKGAIVLEDDVWIGSNVIVLSGVRIGKGSVIGAGSIVSKDIPPYSIYVKDKVIKKRFSNTIINKLLKIDFSKIDKKFVCENINLFNTCINEKNIDKIIHKLNTKN